MMVPNLQVKAGWGILGFGDNSHGIARHLVEETASNTPAFVSSYSFAWKQRTSQPIPETPKEPKSTCCSCFQDRGFCIKRLDGKYDDYKSVETHILSYVQLHRKRHLVRGKNMGPSATIPHPLLVVCERSLEHVCIQ